MKKYFYDERKIVPFEKVVMIEKNDTNISVYTSLNDEGSFVTFVLTESGREQFENYLKQLTE